VSYAIIQPLRSLVQTAALHAGGWNHRLFCSDKSSIGWRYHVRWAIEGWTDWLWCLAYEGSDEELLSAENCELPPVYMNARQRAALRPHACYSAHCSDCRWAGAFLDAVSEHCPRCGKPIWIEPVEWRDGPFWGPRALLPECCGGVA